MSEKPYQLERDAIHLGGGGRAVAVPEFNQEYERYMAAHCTQEEPGWLVGVHESQEDWAMWEIHPAGEEIVIVTRGRAEFLQEIGGEVKRIVVGPNQAIVNPAGVPHTANVIEAFTAVYITPCPGTHHRPRTDRGG